MPNGHDPVLEATEAGDLLRADHLAASAVDCLSEAAGLLRRLARLHPEHAPDYDRARRGLRVAREQVNAALGGPTLDLLRAAEELLRPESYGDEPPW